MSSSGANNSWSKLQNWYMPGRKLFYDTFGDNFESPERSTRLGVRAIAILGGVVGGALKPFLLPVWLVASTVALPIIGAMASTDPRRAKNSATV